MKLADQACRACQEKSAVLPGSYVYLNTTTSLSLHKTNVWIDTKLVWVIPGQVITKYGRTPSDFNETWYIHTLSEVINSHLFFGLLCYMASELQFFTFNFLGNFQLTRDT